MATIINKINRRIFQYLVRKYGVQLKDSYSQAGEDAIVRFLFNSRTGKLPTYLELGTHIPDTGNNTYLFYRLGSKGVCVEADGAIVSLIQRVRPRDTVVHAGVVSREGETADFFVFDEPSLNTFDREEASRREESGKYRIVRIDRVPLVTINRLIADNFVQHPDFISVDIEGYDLAVLKSMDFGKYPVPAICVETCGYSESHIKPKNTQVADFLESVGYFVYADTYINTVFVNKNWFHGLLA